MTPSPRKKVVRELPAPQIISDDTYEIICKICDIPRAARPALKAGLDELVSELARAMEEDRQIRERTSDRSGFNEARKAIEKARVSLGKTGPHGKKALKAAAGKLGSMVTSMWLRNRFPGDGLLPSTDPVSGEFRTNREWQLRGEDQDIEQDSLNARLYFASLRSVPLLCAILEDIERGLDAAATRIKAQPGARGGRKPLTRRRDFIVNLAMFWERLGRQATSGDSAFAVFCESVADAVKWPKKGLNAALPDAIKTWRNRR